MLTFAVIGRNAGTTLEFANEARTQKIRIFIFDVKKLMNLHLAWSTIGILH